MTVPTTNITSGPYVGNDLVDTYDFDFGITDESEIRVFETDDEGVVTELELGTHFTVDIVDEFGGTVTRVAGELPSGYEWYIRSNIQSTQDTAFASQGAFFPAIHEAAFDKATKLIQQLEDILGRTLRTPDYDSSGAVPTLPIPNAGFGLRWSDDGLNLANFPLPFGSLVQIRQIFTAADGPTTFTLKNGATYSSGTNNIALFIDGRRQHPSSYTETSTTSFTLSEALSEGQELLAIINQVDTSIGLVGSLTPETGKAVLWDGVTATPTTGLIPNWDGIYLLPSGGDDTAIVQAAIDAGNPEIVLYAGTWNIGDLTYTNPTGVESEVGIIIRGVGKKKTIVNNTGASAFITIDGALGLSDGNESYLRGIVFADMTILGDGVTAGQNAITATATWGMVLRNVDIKNHLGAGLEGKLKVGFTNPDYSAIIRTVVDNCDITFNAYGIKTDDVFGIEGITIRDSAVSWNTKAGIYGVITYLVIEGGSVAFNGSELYGSAFTPDVEYGGISIPVATSAAIPRSPTIKHCEIDGNVPQNVYIMNAYNPLIQGNAIATRAYNDHIPPYSVILGAPTGTAGAVPCRNGKITQNLFRLPTAKASWGGETTTFVLSNAYDYGSEMDEQLYAITDAVAATDYFFAESLDKDPSTTFDGYLYDLHVSQQNGVGITSPAYKLRYLKEFFGTIADDGVFSILPPTPYGIMTITRAFGATGSSAIIAYDAAANTMTLLSTASASSSIDLLTNTVLTGTTGTNGRVTISEQSASGKIYIENRLGGVATFIITFQPSLNV